MKKIVFIILVFTYQIGFGQFDDSPFLQSPNVAGLGIYGFNEISPFTGLPDIGINVFSLRHGDLNIKADLRYFGGGVKPEAHPGWVGQNFSLHVGGVVTRKVNFGSDEVKAGNNNGNQYAYLYNYGTLNTSNWTNSSFMASFANNNSTGPDKANSSPDEFMFTLPTGASGSFFLNHEGKWVVQSSHPGRFLVTVDVNLQPYKLRHVSNSSRYIDITRLMYKIVIIDNSGTKYTFGNSHPAIEFIRSPKAPNTQDPHNADVIANAWHLTKIESATGSIVDFIYERKENQYVQSVSYGHRVSNSITSQAGFTCSLAQAVQDYYSSQIITPSYLKEIVSPSFHVFFDISETTELRYPYRSEAFQNYGYGDLDFNNTENIPGYFLDLTPPKWYKLDQIRILDKNDVVTEKYSFTYNNIETERLFLKKFTRIDLEQSQNAEYLFEYNTTPLPAYNSKQIDQWGYYNNKPFPSNTTNLSANQVLSYLAPNSTFMKAGTLVKITFPTGGTSEFVYEPNDYSQVIEKNGSSIGIDEKTGIAGGLRIKSIINSDKQNNRITKDFIYKKASNVNKSSGILAGKKKVYAKYVIGNPLLGSAEEISNNTISDLNYTNGREVVYSEVKERLSDGSYTLYTYSNSDNILYRDEVPLSVYSDAFRLRWYTPASSAWNSSYTQPLPSHSSREMERGRLLSKKSYSSTGVLVHELSNEYRDDVARFNEYVRAYDIYGVQVECSLGYVNERYFQAVKIYTYFPYLKRQTETTYSPEGNTPVTVVRDYVYDHDYRVLKEEIYTDSRGVKRKTRIRYPFDIVTSLPTNPGNTLTYAQMVKKNILRPVETVNMLMEGLDKYVVDAKVNRYINTQVQNDENQLIYAALPTTEFVLQTGDKIPENNFAGYYVDVNETDNLDSRMKAVNQVEYNSRGKMISSYNPQSSPNGEIRNSVIWNQDNSYPIAEVRNANIQDVFYSGFEDDALTQEYDAKTGKFSSEGFYYQMNNIQNGTYALSYWFKEGGIWKFHTQENINVTSNSYIININEQVDDVRFHPVNAKITTYTHSPLVGMTSTTDDNHRSTYYEYDGLNRLKNIRNHDREIVKNYTYAYQTLGNTTPQWEDTGARLCVEEYGFKTGEEKKQQRDINFHSPTYNSTRWISLGITSTCPKPTIYAHIEYSNFDNYNGSNSSYTEADITVALYTDMECTKPYYPNSPFTINYRITTEVDDTFNGYTSWYDDFTAQADPGSNYVDLGRYRTYYYTSYYTSNGTTHTVTTLLHDLRPNGTVYEIAYW